MPTGRKALPKFEVVTDLAGYRETLRPIETEEGHLEYEIKGGQTVNLAWTVSRNNSRNRKD
jgi:hypothetical protein